MPNWCENIVDINSNNTTKLQELHDYLQKENKLFQMLEPLPAEYENSDYTEEQLTELYGYKDWYTWQVAHWGTKWDIDLYNVGYTPGETMLTISFGTAWSPAGEQILMKLAEFVDEGDISTEIHNSYYEPGNCFVGTTTAYFDTNGYPNFEEHTYDIVSIDCYDNKSFRDQYIDSGLPSDLVDTFGLADSAHEHCQFEFEDISQ